MIELTSDHEYFVDGRKVPGFTEIATAMGLVSYYNCDPYYLERGSAVHAATALFDTGKLDWDSVDPRIEGYLEAYIRFRTEASADWDHTEEPLYHPTYRYCGTPDRFSPLIDIKTGQGYVIQLEAYAELLRANGYDPDRTGYMLHLKENGTYKLETHKYDRKLRGIWLSAVSVFHYRKDKGLL
jgi:hypothetical protein